MDKSIKAMDNFTKHFRPYSREFNLYPRLDSTGYMRQKRNWVDTTFTGCNYSLILSGRGEYVLRGTRIPVVAPCVLLEWPGEPMFYGPLPGESWEELYLIYPGEEREKLKSTRAFEEDDRPVRPIANSRAVREAIRQLTDGFTAGPNADRIDAAAWQLVMATYAPAEAPRRDPLVDCIEKALENELAGKVNFAALAARLRLSESTMRRRWQAVHDDRSYSDYRAEILLERSCRLLAETDDRIKEIAAQLGFSDVFYFIRRFRQLSGMTPTAYRRRYKPFWF